MRATYLPLITLLAACAGGAAAVETAPVAANTGVDPLQCALQQLSNSSYRREGGSVEAGFLRFSTYRQRGGMMTVPYDSSLLTITRSDGALRVEGPADVEANLRRTLLPCYMPLPEAAQSESSED